LADQVQRFEKALHRVRAEHGRKSNLMKLIDQKGWQPRAEITLEESSREIRALTDRAEQVAAERNWPDAAGQWQAVLAHPCAHHQVVA
jgi:hypothetical protein